MKVAIRERDIQTGGIASRTDFTIKAGAHIMAVLSGLYKNPIDAMVREYLTNMFDAVQALLRVHPDAEVIPSVLTLPSALAQELVFADNGIGMSCETVMEVYSQYGNSTKNDSNLEVGGFGLGSKTAFCYNDGSTWTIESRFDGMKHVFMACIGETGIPQLAHVGSSKTDEHSGVTIRIPIRRQDITECYEAANRYVPYFTHPLEIAGDRKVKGAVQYSIRGKTWGIRAAEKDERGYGYSRNHEWRVIMGNVPYDINWYDLKLVNSHSEFYQNNFDLYVPIGSVDIVPSRDSLKMTDRTRKAIQDAMKGVVAEIGTLLNTKIATAKSEWEALLTFAALDDIKGAKEVVTQLKWKGRVLDTQKGITRKLSELRALDPHVSVRRYGVVDTDKSTIDVTELTKATDELSLRTDERTWLIVEDTPKGIQKVKALLYEKLVNKTSAGRTARYGHKIGHALVVKTSLSQAELSTLFGGYPTDKILTASALRGGKLPSSMKSSVDTIYRWNGRAWDARVNIPDVAGTKYFYCVLEKGVTGRYVWENVKGNYSPADTTEAMVRFAGELGITGVGRGTLYGVKKDEVSKIDTTRFTDLYEAVQTKILENVKQNLRVWAVWAVNENKNGLSAPSDENTIRMIFALKTPTTDPLFAQTFTTLAEREKVRQSGIVRLARDKTFYTADTQKQLQTLIAGEVVETPSKLIEQIYTKYPLFGMIIRLMSNGGYNYRPEEQIRTHKKVLLDFLDNPR